MGRLIRHARTKLMGNTILRKNLVSDFEPATIPQLINESCDDLFGWVHGGTFTFEFNRIWQACRLAANSDGIQRGLTLLLRGSLKLPPGSRGKKA